MPTEHEFKYLIDLKFAEDFDHDTLSDQSINFVEINQGYLVSEEGMAARIRCVSDRFGFEDWLFTFKRKLPKRLVEIESKIDHRDGQELIKNKLMILKDI